MRLRFIAVGALLGMLIGVIVSFIFPDLLRLGAGYNRNINTGLGLPLDYNPKSGAVINSLMFMPILLGVLGGLFGLILFKLLRLQHNFKK